MLVIQIDAVGSEALQGSLNHFPDVLRSAVKNKAAIFIVEANLVAIATLSRTGASAAPTSSSFV